MIKTLQKIRAEKGFTLAELLVVILIIAILATLAIVFFTGQEETAQTNVSKGNIRSAYSSAQALYVANDGAYPATLVDDMKLDGVDASSLATAATAAPASGVGVHEASGVLTLKAGTCTGSNSTGPLVVTCS